MRGFRRFSFRSGSRALLRDERGVAAVEFALISAAMFMMLSGGVDLTRAVIAQRDLNRFTAELAQVLAECRSQGCVVTTITNVNLRLANAAPGISNLQLGAAEISRRSDSIKTEIGTLTYLEADMTARAMTALQNGDYGVAVRATSSVQPIILGFAQKWGFTVKNFRSFAIALRDRNGAA